MAHTYAKYIWGFEPSIHSDVYSFCWLYCSPAVLMGFHPAESNRHRGAPRTPRTSAPQQALLPTQKLSWLTAGWHVPSCDGGTVIVRVPRWQKAMTKVQRTTGLVRGLGWEKTEGEGSLARRAEDYERHVKTATFKYLKGCLIWLVIILVLLVSKGGCKKMGRRF